MRRVGIRTRLIIAFFIVASFSLAIGLIGFINLNFIGKSSVKTVRNIAILSDVYDYNIAVYNCVHNMVYTNDFALSEYLLRTTQDYSAKMVEQMNGYLETQEHFSEVFSPGEMQDMANLLEIYTETYIPVLNEIIELVEQGRREEALSISVNRLDPIYNTLMHTLNSAFKVNLEYSETFTARNSQNALRRAYLMLMFVLSSLLASIALALAVTRSISRPLFELESVAETVAFGGPDAEYDRSRFNYMNGNDEIMRLGRSLDETLKQLTQMSNLKVEAVEARYEKEKAEASVRAKSDFLAKMSHEIRTPMNAIIGMAELALREDMPDTPREHVFTIKQAGVNLLSIINDILDFSKIESGRLEIVPDEYLFSSLLNDVISIIRMRVVDSQVRFVVNIDSGIPQTLFGDEIRIRQILLNLLNNAVKFTQKGHVSFTVAGETDGDAVTLTMEISDSGRGIKPEDIGRLFDDFVQVDSAQNKGVEGTGLGLAIAQNLVKAMGGNIAVISEYGKGSTFTLTLPQKVCGSAKIASVENPEKKSVLIYERREMYANSIICTVDNLGVECTLVSNVSELREKLEHETYSFIFIASGLYESAREIFERLAKKTKIVLLTGFGEAVADKSITILAMPVYCVSVANILNDVSGGFSYSESGDAAVRVIAPNASVLVVDDINTNLNVAKGLLLPYKMRIDLRLSGMEAIEAASANRYDLILMDHMMPGMDGIETVRRIRALDAADAYYANVPIVALTANAVSGAKEMFLANGFNDFLSKPIDTVKLNAALVKWIPKEKQMKITDEGGDDAKTPGGEDAGGIKIEGLNVKKGVAITGGSVESYKNILAVFRNDGMQKLSEIRMCLKTDNLPLYSTYVHALKSAAANIGATELSEMAKALEAAGKQENIEFIKTHNPELESALESLARNIGGFLDAERKEEIPADMAILRTALVELEEAIDAINPRAIKAAVKSIRPFAQAADVGGTVENILQYILVGEYDEAVSTIKTLLQEKPQ